MTSGATWILLLWLALLAAIAAVSYSAWNLIAGTAPLVETFDRDTSSFANRLLAHEAISMAEDGGVAASNGIYVVYHGFPRGSRRIVVHQSLPISSLDATLTYDVKFCDDFQFAKGGKLHGLGPAKPIAGGMPVGDAQWSARVLFRRNGGIATYLYHQDLQGRYGDATVAAEFSFEPDQYYSVALYVRLNNPPEARNGRAELYINGRKVVTDEQVRFRATGGEETLIQTLIFSTFHGGHTPDFAPRRKDGSFSQECAYFDNFAVYPGLHIQERH